MIPLNVELDGRPLAVLGRNTYTRVDLAPGAHTLAAADTYITRISYGAPRPLRLTVEAGKSYFILPTRSVENLRPEIKIIGTTVVPGTTGDVFGGFAVHGAPGGAAPPEFAQLSYVAAEEVP
jgi:hypothetical protein